MKIKVLIIALTCLLILTMLPAPAQTVDQKGRPIIELFSDFHYHLKGDSTQTTGFDLPRAHFGYKYQSGDHLSASVMVNIGTPDDLSEGNTPRRYAYFKEASVTYNTGALSLNFGMTGTRIFSFQ